MRRGLSALVGVLLVVAVALLAEPAQAAGSSDPATQLLERYSPVVVVRTQSTACSDGEPYLPTVVESVLGQPDVVLRGPGGATVAAPTARDLAGKGDGWYVDLPGDPLSPGCDYDSWPAASTGLTLLYYDLHTRTAEVQSSPRWLQRK